MTNRQKPPLSGLENVVMGVIWERGQATAEAIRSTLEPTQPMKDSTVRTVLRRLEAKGYVEHLVDGRTYVYTPTIASRTVAADTVGGIIDRLCEGSIENLLLGMVDREMVSPEKLQDLARRIAESEESTKQDATPKRRRGR
jgi:predicted transcriptional regulator